MRDPSRATPSPRIAETLVEAASDALVALTVDGRFLSWNRGAQVLFGYGRTEVAGRSLCDLLPADASGRAALQRALSCACETGSATLDLTSRERGGAAIETTLSIQAVRSDGGAVEFLALQARSSTRPTPPRAEAMLRDALETSPQASLILDSAGNVVFVNARALALFGHARGELLGKPLGVLSGDAEQASGADAQALARALAEGRYEDEGFPRRKDGQRFRSTRVLRPIRDEAGTLSGFVLEIHDVTQRQQAESKFRALLEAAPDAMIITDRDGCISLVNARAEQLFGYSRTELLHQRIEILVPERYRARHEGYRIGFLAERKVRAMGSGRELYGLRKDGSEFPVEISLSPLETEEGVFVTSAIRDVTERKKAEELRVRLAALVDASDDAIIGKTLDGLVTSWNKGATRIFGYAAAEMIGSPIMRLIPAELEAEEHQILARLQRGERVDHFDTVRRRKDGRLIDVSVAISPVSDKTGRIVGAAKVAIDITARKSTEENLARAKETAEAASRELEAFSYSVAHDLRAPLRSIAGFSHAVLEDYGERLDDEGRSYLQRVCAAANRMGHLIDDLLALSRVTRVELRREPVDLTRVADEIAERLRQTEPERDLEFVIAERMTAEADPHLLGIALENLLGNAAKFTRRKPKARIEVGVRPGGRTFFVRDNGAGFDMAHAQRLFGAFQRLHRNTEFEGTGIGLATVQRVINRHGGRIWAEAEVDRGATFYFTL